MLKGFKEFISQGNVLDLAVAVIIGAAFAPIVEAITTVIMTIIGALVGQPNFDTVGMFHINGHEVKPGTIVTQAVNFLLIALAVYFFIVLPMNKLKERRKQEEAAEPTDVELLTEIRDLLAGRR